MSNGRGGSKSKKKKIEYAADFETTIDPDDCRVWLWGIAYIDEPENVEWGIDIESFINRIKQQNAVVSFHNLKFDGTFIMDWLMKNGYTHTTDKMHNKRGIFSTLISDNGMFYSITINWHEGFTLELRDSLKKIPMSVERAAQAFKLDRMKGELDHKKLRPVGYDPTEEELEYLYNDVYIVASILRQTRDEGMTRLTVASDSMTEFKRLIGEKTFKMLFPVLSIPMDKEIRQAYRGGFTYKDERYASTEITRSGVVLDVNSLYPFVMYEKLLPYGQPEFFNGASSPTDTHPLTIFTVSFTAKLKPGHIPCIQIKGNHLFSNTEYLTEIKDSTTLTVTNVDWELWNEHYDIEVDTYEGGWRFKGAHNIFKAYIDKWAEIKANSTGGLREIAKLHLNSLYGKFASNPSVTGKVPYLKDDKVSYIRGPEETRNPVYTAMGAFITAYARALTIRAAQANYDTFAYADTDSLHLLRDTVPEELDVHETRMGAWAFEYSFRRAMFVRPKFYLEEKADGTFVTKVAGLPERISKQLRFDHITEGRVIHDKLQPRNVPGGQILREVDFTIKL